MTIDSSGKERHQWVYDNEPRFHALDGSTEDREVVGQRQQSLGILP